MKKNFLLLVTSTILIISFGFSTVVSLRSMEVLVRENNRDNSVIYANEVSNAVIDVFSEAIAVSQSLNNTFIRDFLKNERNLSIEEQSALLRRYLSDIVYKFGYSTAFMADAKTMAYYSEHGYSKTIDIKNPDDDWYQAFKDSGKAYELNVDNDQANYNRLTIYINMRIVDNSGEFLGACGVGVPMKQVMTLLQSLEAQSDISIKLVSPDGIVRVAKSGQLVFQRTEEELRAMLKKYDYSQMYYYEPKKEDGYTIIKYIPECDWFAVIDYEGGRASDSSTMLFKNLMTCLIVLLAVLIVVNSILNRFTKHTERFVEEALEDSLTGLKNRRSYALEIEKLNKFQSLDSVSVATMDINGLKLTNDNFGMECLRQLNGIKYLAIGNHDSNKRLEQYYNAHIFECMEYGYRFSYNKITFYFQHYPAMMGNYDTRPIICLAGHTHSPDKFENMGNKCYNVSLDAHHCNPVSMDTIVKDIINYNKTHTAIDYIDKSPYCKTCGHGFSCVARFNHTLPCKL